MKLLPLVLLLSPLLTTASPSQPPANISPRQWYIGKACTNTLYSNVYGTCQKTSTCSSRKGVADTNPDCPGPDNVQCCIMDDCVNGASGTCLDTRQWNCRGGGGWNRYVFSFFPSPAGAGFMLTESWGAAATIVRGRIRICAARGIGGGRAGRSRFEG